MYAMNKNYTLEKARENAPGVSFRIMDMRDFRTDKKYDTVICYNDSLNYLESESELASAFQAVWKALRKGGVFLFDVHQKARLKEFEEEFIEEGKCRDAYYQWSIQAENDHLCHHLSFWIGNEMYEEEHIQTVFAKRTLKKLLKETGFDVTVYTDFEKDENRKGEKWYFVAQKKEKAD